MSILNLKPSFNSMPSRWASTVLVSLALLLAACSNEQGDDLDQFIRNAGNDMQARIEPLPEVLPYVAATYNEDGLLNDPFRPKKIANARSSSLQPNMNRPREPLEAFPLESLKFVGSLSKEKLRYALIQTPDNMVQQVKLGSYMGENFGIVTSITETGLTLKEIIQDELTGDWTERTSSIELQE